MSQIQQDRVNQCLHLEFNLQLIAYCNRFRPVPYNPYSNLEQITTMTTEGADVKHENDFDEEYFQFVSMSETNARLLLHEEYFQFVSMSKTNARLLYMYKFDTFPLSGHERRFS